MIRKGVGMAVANKVHKQRLQHAPCTVPPNHACIHPSLHKYLHASVLCADLPQPIAMYMDGCMITVGRCMHSDAILVFATAIPSFWFL